MIKNNESKWIIFVRNALWTQNIEIITAIQMIYRFATRILSVKAANKPFKNKSLRK